MKQGVSFFQVISLILCFALCVVSLQGFFRFGHEILLLFGAWLLLTLFAFSGTLKQVLLQKRFIFFYIFIITRFLFLICSMPIGTAVNNTVDFLCKFSPILMYETLKTQKRGIIGVFLLGLFGIIGVNMALSYIYLEATAAISMRGANELGEEYYIVEVAFNTCYSLAIIVPVLIDIVKNRFGEKQSYKWFNLLIVAASAILFFYLIKAQFMTAVLLSIVGIFVCLFYKKKRLFSFIIGAIAIYIIGISLLPSLVKALNANEDYKFLAQRVEEIHSTLTGNANQASDLNERRSRSTMSLETFLKNPIIGVGYKLDYNRHVQEQGIGNHASWQDSLAEYGLFALLLFFFIYDSLRRQKSATGSGLTMFLVIIMGFLNPIFYFPQMTSAFLIAPLSYLFLSSGNNQNKLVRK